MALPPPDPALNKLCELQYFMFHLCYDCIFVTESWYLSMLVMAWYTRKIISPLLDRVVVRVKAVVCVHQ